MKSKTIQIHRDYLTTDNDVLLRQTPGYELDFVEISNDIRDFPTINIVAEPDQPEEKTEYSLALNAFLILPSGEISVLYSDTFNIEVVTTTFAFGNSAPELFPEPPETLHAVAGQSFNFRFGSLVDAYGNEI